MKVLDVIRMAAGRPDLAYAGEPVPLSGGFWAVLLAFTLADPPPGWPRELVARVMPDAGLARKETIVQAVVASAGFPTPAVRVSGGPDAGLGQAFMVMDRAPGSPLLSSLSGAGAVGAAFRLARQLPGALASTMAGLHALDPGPLRAALDVIDDVPVTVNGLLAMLEDGADGFGRSDLAAAARWLIAHPPAQTPEVVCHGDLHPFNLLVDGDQVTVLDWSVCMLGPRAHDVAFTALMLSEPPVRVPPVLRPLIRWAGRSLAARFVRSYRDFSGVMVAADEFAWHQAVVCLRALTEVASWGAAGAADDRAGHPWLVSGHQLAARLTYVTGIPVRPF